MERSAEPLSDHVLARQLDRLTALAEPEDDGASELRWAYREAAAVLSSFDVKTLKPFGIEAPEGGAYQYLLDDLAPLDSPAGVRWSLGRKVREETLKRLGSVDRLRGALAANPVRPRDAVQRALDAYIAGRPRPLEGQSVEDLIATVTVVGWLRDLIPEMPSESEVRRHRDRATFIQQFQGAPPKLYGRDDEQNQLRDYLPGAVTSLYGRPPVFVHGPGGSGKSSLLARLILDRVSEHAGTRPLFAHFDGSKLPDIVDRDLALLVETVKQVAVQAEKSRDEWERLRRRWAQQLEASRAAPSDAVGKGRHLDIIDRAKVFNDFREALERESRPLVFVFDDFDEVAYRTEALVGALWNLLNELQGLCPTMRCVMAGCQIPSALPFQPLELTGLDSYSSEQLVESVAELETELVQKIVDQAGGNPLRLRLAAEVADRGGPYAVAFHGGSKASVDAALYRALIDGESLDAGTRRLALFSFVPRRVTPDVVKGVLAAPCGVEVRNDTHALELFVALGRTLKFSTSDHAGLRHPSDIRLAMLEFLRQAHPDRSNAVHSAAVSYYESHPAPDAQLERLYHLLSLRDPPRGLAAFKTELRALGRAVEDLPPIGQKCVADTLGLTLPAEVVRRAEVESWERNAVLLAGQKLDDNHPAEALVHVRERADRSPTSPLFLLEARAHRQLGDLTAARGALERGLVSTRPLGDSPMLVDLLLCDSELDVLERRLDEACRTLEEAYATARRIESDERVTDAGVRRLRLYGLLGLALPPALADQVRAASIAVPETVFRRRPALLRELALAIGEEHPDVIRRAARLVGFALPATPEREKLAALFAGTRGGDRPFDEAGLAGAVLAFLDSSPKAADLKHLVSLLGASSSALPDVAAGEAAPLNAASIEQRRSSGVRSERSVALNGEQQQELSEALRGAFPKRRLEQMLFYRLDKRLEDISLGHDYQEIVFDLIQAADNEGWVAKLIVAARSSNPGNARLLEFAQALGLSASTLTLERKVREELPYLDVAKWRARLGEIETQICRVEIDRPEGMIYGTGFLVGADLVMTNYHVMESVIEGSTTPEAVVLRFDYKRVNEAELSQGMVFRLAANWLVDSSPYAEVDSSAEAKVGVPADDELDYALMRVADAPGAAPVGPKTEDGAAPRKWISLLKAAATPGADAPLFIVQHPDAAPLKLAMDTRAVLGENANRTRLKYRVNTESGSSGSPVFDMNWDLVALHHSGDPNFDPAHKPAYNEGIPVSAILRLLEKRGKKGELSE